MRRNFLCLLLVLCIFTGAALPAYADEADVAKSEDGIEITSEYAEEVRQMRGEGILDTEELDRMVEAYVEEHKLKKEDVSIGYCYLETGDEYYFNGDTWYYPGSVYKVPLMMLIAEKVSTGELDQDGDFMGMSLNKVEEYILTYSNNDWAHNVRRWLHDGAGDQVWRKAAMGYADMDESYYSQDYLDYCYYSARYITKVLETLYYGGEERFPNVVPCMLNASPTNYFKLSDDMKKYDIAQKYGSYVDQIGNNWNSTVGIVYTEHPFALSVLTRDARSYEKAISDAVVMFTAYTQEVDGRLDAYREAQAEQEAQRKEEERIEAERRKAETEEAKREQLAAEQKVETEEKQENLRSAALIVGVAGGALALGLILGAVLTARHNKKKRYAEYKRRFEEEMREEERQRREAMRARAGRDFAENARPRQYGDSTQPRRRPENGRPARPRPKDPEE